MKMIVTGGEGFIGKALTAALKKRGVEVAVIDRRAGIEVADFFRTADLSDIDCVYHLAAQTSVFNTDNEAVMADNINAFMVVCDACRRYNVRLVYASSSTANGCNTTSLYGISKRFDEQYAACYHPGATGVRLHNIYGPDPRQGTLLWHIPNDNPVKLVNAGRNVRHFTFISDAVEGFIYAYGSGEKLLNVANPEETSVYDFALEVEKYKPLEIVIDRHKRDFDRKAQTVDESIPTVPLQYVSVAEGIRRCLEHETEK